ncbi:MAG: hypothetical protein ACFB2X_07020 [Rivularia sp. (in: cyanobacteria)]
MDTIQNIPAIADNSSSNEVDTQSEDKFAINNQEEYNQLVQKVIADYQENKISENEAINMIENANQYVRNEVNPILYPDENLRKQLSELIGFDYAIDQKQAQKPVN